MRFSMQYSLEAASVATRQKTAQRANTSNSQTEGPGIDATARKPYTMTIRTAQPSIIVYTQPYCPSCRHAKAFLDELGVQYEELDVSEDYDARDDLWEVHGSQNTPTFVIDGEVIIGFRRDSLKARLQAVR
jgi:glutaredoxin 3